MTDPVYNGNLWQGSVWRYGEGAPSPSLGVKGDFYLRTDTDQIYYRTGVEWIVTQDITGYTGSRGDTGFNGSRGFTGSTGFTGSASTAPGPQGLQGFTGSSGFTGSFGQRGYAGSLGYTGSIGYTGSRGFTGSASTEVGPPGPTGPEGPLGYTGSASTVIGYTGSLGYTGSQGFVGSTGISGTLFPVLSFTNVTGTQNLDASIARVWSLTCTGSTTLAFINPPVTLQQFIAYIYVTNNGGTVTTWPTGTIWTSGLAPTMTTTSGKTDIITLLTINGGTTWYGTVAGQNF